MTEPGEHISDRSLLKGAFYEAAFVLLGVLLALGGQAWWESAEEAERADVALQAIEDELASNLREVQASFLYHAGLIELLQERQQSGTPLDYPDMRHFPEGFVRPAELLTTAWETARLTARIDRIGYERMLMIGRLYTFQSNYDRMAGNVSGSIFDVTFEEGIGGMLARPGGLMSWYYAFAHREAQLARCYRLVLEALGADAPEIDPAMMEQRRPDCPASISGPAGTVRAGP